MVVPDRKTVRASFGAFYGLNLTNSPGQIEAPLKCDQQAVILERTMNRGKHGPALRSSHRRPRAGRFRQSRLHGLRAYRADPENRADARSPAVARYARARS